MLDTPPLRKRRGPWPVKGRWAGKIFPPPPVSPAQKTFFALPKRYGRKR